MIVSPGGYLSPIPSGWPVITSNALNSTSVWFTPEQYNGAPVHDGTGFVMTTPGQLRLDLRSDYLADVIRCVYLFDGGSGPVIGASPPWHDSGLGTSTPGYGAGEPGWGADPATWMPCNVNPLTMTNGASSWDVPAGRALYLGAICPSADGQVNCQVSIGQYRVRDIANRWNERPILQRATDPATAPTEDYYLPPPAGKWRHSNANPYNCIRVLTAMPQSVEASFSQVFFSGENTMVDLGIQVNDAVDSNGDPVASGLVGAAGRNVADTMSARAVVDSAFGQTMFRCIEKIESYQPGLPQTGSAEMWGREMSMWLTARSMG